MHKLLILPLLLIWLNVFAQSLGSYSGNPKTERSSDGRVMKLLEDFSYTDPKNRKWTAPKGLNIDGATIPRFAWTFIGGPFEGKYRNSSIIHDAGCELQWAPWEVVHEVFYMGMIASGVEEWRAKVMYAAVYLGGPRWERMVQVSGLPATQTPVARARALEGAALGSQAEILAVSPPYSPLNPDQPATFFIQVRPPPTKFTQQEFEMSASELEVTAKGGQQTPSLEELRTRFQ